jgi:hypothetical protein
LTSPAALFAAFWSTESLDSLIESSEENSDDFPIAI